MQQVVISVCAWCEKFKGWKVYEAPEGNEPVIVSSGICPECAKREYMALPGLGVVQLASPAEIEAGKAEELARVEGSEECGG